MDHLFPISYAIVEIDGMGTDLLIDPANQYVCVRQHNIDRPDEPDTVILVPDLIRTLISTLQKHITSGGVII